MNLLTSWLRSYLPTLTASDRQLADDLTLRGIAAEGVFDLGATNGSLFEMDITTNRVDAMNHYGVAREAAAIYGLTLKSLDTTLPAAQPGAAYPVRIEAPELCGRFTARALRGVTIQPSAGAVADRFQLLDQKQISNAVDATNYVMLAMGQPTHVFDLDKLQGAIVVRRARKGEKLRTLDGVERTLEAEDLVVADERKALGLAGVMGGWDSMITPETKNILVEAAWFDPDSVRRMSRRHAIHSDASHRFERGADFNAPPVASALVSKIILQSGGEVAGDFADVVIPAAELHTAKRSPVTLSIREVQRLLGTTTDGLGITQETCVDVLTALGCTLASESSPGTYAVTLPSWRLDLEREIDLIEEIARVYGYNRFANTLPSFSGIVIELPHATRESAVRELLLAAGYNEAVSSTFASATDADTFAPQPRTAVPMGNPLNEEAGTLRPSLLPGMLTMVENNLSRNVDDVRLFEMGTIFSGPISATSIDRVDEQPSLAFVATGSITLEAVAPGVQHGQRRLTFYDVKGVVEAVVAKFAHRSVYYDALLLPAWLHPGIGARCVVDGSTIGYFGQLHPAEAERRKFKQPVLIGELSLERLYRQELRQPAARELSRFQAVARDFSFLMPAQIAWQGVAAALENLHIPELASFRPADIFPFQGSKDQAVPAGQYSLLVRTTFQSLDRTLRDEALQSWSQAIIDALRALGGTHRDETTAAERQ